MYSVPSGPVNGAAALVEVAGPLRGRQAEGVGAQRRARGAHQHRAAEGLPVVVGVHREDVSRAVRGEDRPRHVDPVAERAGRAVVDRHVALVVQDRAGRVEGLDRGVAGEVPGGAGVAGGAEHVDGAGLVGVVGRRCCPAHEHLARVVGVAPAVPGHRRVAAGLPVLPGHVAEGGAAGEPVGHGAVGPA